MAQMATLEETETRFTGDDIIPILEAEDEAAMWDADERPRYNAKMLSGCTLEITGFDVKFSGSTDEDIKTPFVDPASGKQMYLLVGSVRLNNSGEKKEIRLPEVGEEFTWNTSARNIVGKLFWMLRHGWFDNGAPPVRLRIEGTELAGGKKSVEKLKQLDAHTVVTIERERGQRDDTPF
jgi:hypothetical protein